MKLTTVTKSYKEKDFSAYIMEGENRCIIDMVGWDRQYTVTLVAARKRAKEMIDSKIIDFKYS